MSTAISDLPQGNNQNNITLETRETHPPQLPPPATPALDGQPIANDQTQMNQIVSGIQKASAVGATQLPSRDIPQNTTPLVQDPQAAPNFIPEPPAVPEQPRYYIPEHDPQQLLHQQEGTIVQKGAWEELYNEIHIPVLVTVLFLLFQLPITQKYFKNVFPFSFNSDGNQNILGYLIYSLIFGILFYAFIIFLKRNK